MRTHYWHFSSPFLPVQSSDTGGFLPRRRHPMAQPGVRHAPDRGDEQQKNKPLQHLPNLMIPPFSILIKNALLACISINFSRVLILTFPKMKLYYLFEIIQRGAAGTANMMMNPMENSSLMNDRSCSRKEVVVLSAILDDNCHQFEFCSAQTVRQCATSPSVVSAPLPVMKSRIFPCSDLGKRVTKISQFIPKRSPKYPFRYVFGEKDGHTFQIKSEIDSCWCLG